MIWSGYSGKVKWLSKIPFFLHFQMNQQIKIKISFQLKWFQGQPYCKTLAWIHPFQSRRNDPWTFKGTWIAFQTFLAFGQSQSKCNMVSAVPWQNYMQAGSRLRFLRSVSMRISQNFALSHNPGKQFEFGRNVKGPNTLPETVRHKIIGNRKGISTIDRDFNH